MGRHSPEKLRFDKLAQEFFEKLGYETERVGGTLADVVAWHPDKGEFAIIEVKSPKEKDAAIHFESEHSYEDVNGKAREQLWNEIRDYPFATHSPGISRLVAFTISSQLFTYWQKAREHIERFCARRQASIAPLRIASFLVLPTQHKEIARSVLDYFLVRKMIQGYSATESEEIWVAEIRYNPPPE